VKTKAELVEAMARAMCTYQDQDPDRVLESMDKHRQPVIMWTHWKGEADAALSVLRQWLADEGLVIVPAEPTPRMFAANSKCTSQELWAGIGWAAMIAAAPDALDTKGEG
jgi:hypothetical protein